jgi:magnesium transporter
MIDIFYLADKVKKVSIDSLKKLPKEKFWIDVTDINSKEADFIKSFFNLHPLSIEDFQNKSTRIKVEEFPEYLFCVFYGLRKNKEIVLEEIDFAIGKNFIISNHKNDITLFTDLKSNPDKLTLLFQRGPDFIMHYLLNGLIDNYFPVLEEIDDQIEKIEEELAKKPRSEILQNILKLKRKIIVVKKVVLPQREKIGFLAKNQYKFISGKAIPYFRDVYDHSIRVADSIDNYRESVGGTFDAYMSAVSNNMNEVMKMLSIFATIALPLGVISGIYGTNFSNLPGQNFTYGFWLMLLGMFSIIGFMILFFRKRGWF